MIGGFIVLFFSCCYPDHHSCAAGIHAGLCGRFSGHKTSSAVWQKCEKAPSRKFLISAVVTVYKTVVRVSIGSEGKSLPAGIHASAVKILHLSNPYLHCGVS